MLTRTISGIIIFLLILVMDYVGGPTLGLVCLLLSLIGYSELAKAVGVHEENKSINPVECISYVAITAYYIIMTTVSENGDLYYQILLIASIMLILAVYVFTYPRYDWKQIAGNIFSMLYAPVMLGFLYLIREKFEHGMIIFLLVFIASSISDVCAYFVGVTLGKHKLAPVLSPKKSIEGSIGGILGAAAVGAIYAVLLMLLGMTPAAYIPVFALIGGVGSVISQIGDLVASAIKRQTGIKDYGKLIPGHGGIMDRFDSVIATAPIIYYLAYFIIK